MNWKTIAVGIGLALLAIWIANNVEAVGSLVKPMPAKA